MPNVEVQNRFRKNSLVRLFASVAAVSLISASVSILIDLPDHSYPVFLLPSVLITVLCAILAYYAGQKYIDGQENIARYIWIGCLTCISIFPMLQVLPIQYDTELLLYIKNLSPPLWPYSISFPILVFIILETSFKGRGETRTPITFMLLTMLSAVTLIFFASTLIGSIANDSELILLPKTLFINSSLPLLVSFLIILIIVMARKGFTSQAIILAVLIGLIIEYVSTWSYDGPHFLESANFLPYPGFPIIAFLSGTIPGILLAASGLLLGWQTYIKRQQ